MEKRPRKEMGLSVHLQLQSVLILYLQSLHIDRVKMAARLVYRTSDNLGKKSLQKRRIPEGKAL